MTLVVAQVIDDDIRIVADTLYREQTALHEQLFNCALKAIIVSPDCCVCFAGSGEAARIALRPILDHPAMPRNALLTHLHEQHLRFEGAVDFIAAHTGAAPAVARVSGGEVQDGLRVAWIGDHAAFESYQSHYVSLRAAPPPISAIETTASIRNANWMNGALCHVIEDPAHPSVKGFLLRLTSQPAEKDGFRYLAGMSGSGFEAIALSTTPQSLIRPLGAVAGGYRDNILVPKVPGIGAVGIYINEARSGLLSHSQLVGDQDPK